MFGVLQHVRIQRTILVQIILNECCVDKFYKRQAKGKSFVLLIATCCSKP